MRLHKTWTQVAMLATAPTTDRSARMAPDVDAHPRCAALENDTCSAVNLRADKNPSLGCA